MKIPSITTDNLILKPLGQEHSEGMFQLWSDPFVCKYSGVITDYERKTIQTPVKKISQSDRVLDFWIKAACDGWGFRWAVMLAKKEYIFAGTIGYNNLSDCHELAFHLLPKYWGKGIMMEASIVAINWSKTQKASEIESFIMPKNARSIALVKRLGMVPTEEFIEGAQRFHMTL